MTSLRGTAAVILAGLLAGCSDSASPPAAKAPSGKPGASKQTPAASGTPWFAEEATSRGIEFTYASGAFGRYYMPEIMGGGAALFDMDGDGDLDAYLVQGGQLVRPDDAAEPPPPNRLFRNRGDGTFEAVTEHDGDRGYGMGVAAGDYDDDGDLDLYVTNVGPNRLLENDGRGGFTDVTDRYGIGHDGWSTSAAFVDFDHDGDLDLYVCNYLIWDPSLELACINTMSGADYCSPRNYLAPAQDALYRNDGRRGFTDVTGPAGLTAFSGTGLGVVCGDYTGDGRIDIFVANDGMRDQLWVNQADGTFKDLAIQFGCAHDRDGRAAAGMGVTAADLDDDGYIELLVSNLRNESDSLFRNNKGRFFTNMTAAAGLAALSRQFTRFGTAWHDLDHDGRLDLFQANGRVMRQALEYSDDAYAEPNLLMRGVDGGRFEEVEPRGGTAELLIGSSRAAAFGDIDNDGGIDVLIVNRDGPAHLLMNTVPDRGHWVGFATREEHVRDSFGARVTITAGGRTFSRDVRSAYSYLAANDPRVHFGLGPGGESVETIESVKVRWTDGTLEDFGSVKADRYHTLKRGTGRIIG